METFEFWIPKQESKGLIIRGHFMWPISTQSRVEVDTTSQDNKEITYDIILAMRMGERHPNPG